MEILLEISICQSSDNSCNYIGNIKGSNVSINQSSKGCSKIENINGNGMYINQTSINDISMTQNYLNDMKCDYDKKFNFENITVLFSEIVASCQGTVDFEDSLIDKENLHIICNEQATLNFKGTSVYYCDFEGNDQGSIFFDDLNCIKGEIVENNQSSISGLLSFKNCKVTLKDQSSIKRIECENDCKINLKNQSSIKNIACTGKLEIETEDQSYVTNLFCDDCNIRIKNV